jgi:hypothetical protein
MRIQGTTITAPYGETVSFKVRVNAKNIEVNAESGKFLFVVRTRTGAPVFKDVYDPVVDEEGGVYFAVSIQHTDSEQIPVGQHFYGISYYHEAVLEDGIPVDGHPVLVPLANGDYVVVAAAAREGGL